MVGALAEGRVRLDPEILGEFCRRHHIAKLSLFGSVLRDDFRPDSDVDVLVEFEPGHVPGYLRLADVAIELDQLLGREVDLQTAASLSPHFRDEVSASAVTLYAAEADVARHVLRLELHQHVDVAVGAEVVAEDGAEQRHPADAVAAAERGDGLAVDRNPGGHGRCACCLGRCGPGRILPAFGPRIEAAGPASGRNRRRPRPADRPRP